MCIRDREAAPVEDVELVLPPTESTEPVSQGKQPDKPTQTGDVIFQETMMRMMMEMREENKSMKKKMKEELGQMIDDHSRKMDDIINNSKLWREELKIDSKPGREEIPNDKRREQVALLSKIKPNRNKEILNLWK